jgi:hypothetical protein
MVIFGLYDNAETPGYPSFNFEILLWKQKLSARQFATTLWQAAFPNGQDSCCQATMNSATIAIHANALKNQNFRTPQGV